MAGKGEPKKDTKGSDGSDTFKARWVCPVTMLEANGKSRFLAMRPCGCVLSERALKEVPSVTCLKCSKPIKADSAILLAPSKEEFDEAKTRIELRVKEQKEHKEDRREKKEKKDKEKRKAEGNSKDEEGKRQAVVAAPAAAGATAERPEKKKENAT